MTEEKKKLPKYYRKKYNVKQKGSVFERDISKRLSLWLSKDFYDDWLWRTQASGSRYSNRTRNGQKLDGQEGDICATNEKSFWFINHFMIECKAYKTGDVLKFITGMNGCIFQKWYLKALEDAKHKTPLIFIKINSRPLFVLSSKSFIDKYSPLFNPVAIIRRPEETFAITLLDDFLNADIEIFKQITEGRN